MSDFEPGPDDRISGTDITWTPCSVDHPVSYSLSRVPTGKLRKLWNQLPESL